MTSEVINNASREIKDNISDLSFKGISKRKEESKVKMVDFDRFSMFLIDESFSKDEIKKIIADKEKDEIKSHIAVENYSSVTEIPKRKRI